MMPTTVMERSVTPGGLPRCQGLNNMKRELKNEKKIFNVGVSIDDGRVCCFRM